MRTTGPAAGDTSPGEALGANARPACLVLAAALVLAACGTGRNRAPVEDRVAARPVAADSAGSSGSPASDAPKPLPGAENAGKPGYYTVRPGDTLIRIGLENGQNWKDLVRWNNLENPNLIEVGQVLRVVVPGVDPSAASTRPVPLARAETRPLDRVGTVPASTPPPPSSASTSGAASTSGTASPATAASTLGTASPSSADAAPPPTLPAAASTPSPPAAAPRSADDDVNWAWPTAGSVSAPFDEGRAKGLVFNGKAGDPVLAAADGRVVYAGSGLRGYGNLVILKHNNTYLTAYAHNQALLVKEDQSVRRGQKIAEMGATDAERVQLHFEIRKLGKPVDPARLLPPR